MQKANLSFLEYFLTKTMDLSQQLSQGELQGQVVDIAISLLYLGLNSVASPPLLLSVLLLTQPQKQP